MSKIKNLGLAAAAVGVAGCASLQSHTVDADGSTPLEGVSYALPMMQFKLVAAHTLKSCSPSAKTRVATKIDVVPSFVPDPEHTYRIAPSALFKGLSTGSVEVSYHDNGTLKSFGAAAKGEGAAVVTGVLNIAATVAKALAGVSGIDTTEAGEDLCESGVKESLGKIEELKTALKDQTSNLKAAQGLVDDRKAVATLSEGGTEGEREDLFAAMDLLRDALVETEKAREALEDAEEKLTYTTRQVWPATGSERASIVFKPKPTDRKIVEWFGTNADTALAGAVGERLIMVAASGATPVSAAPGDAAPEKGLRYRNPRLGYVVSCKAAPEAKPKDEEVKVEEPAAQGEKAASQNGAEARAERMIKLEQDCAARIADARKEDPIAIPQLGRLHVLPLTVGAFTDRALTASFAQDGRLTAFKYEDKVAFLAGLAKTGADAASLVAGTVAAIEAKDDDAKSLTEKQTAKLLEQQALLQAKVTNASLQLTLDGADEAALKAAAVHSKEVAEADLAEAKARASLAALSGDTELSGLLLDQAIAEAKLAIKIANEAANEAAAEE